MSFSYFICGSTTFMLAVHFVPMAVEEGINPQTAALIFGLMSGLNALGATGAGLDLGPDRQAQKLAGRWCTSAGERAT